MVSLLQRSSPPLHNGDMPREQAWLTNMRMLLLSDTGADHIAATLQHTQTFLQTPLETDEVPGTPQHALALQVGALLDRGIKRRHRPNEDSLLVAQGTLHSLYAPPRLFALFIVADGMGGHARGQEASQLAVQSLVEYVDASLRSKQMTPDASLPLLRAGIQHANQVVYQRNQERRADMGTTMTAALVSDATAYVAHVGDSRAYLLRDSAGLSQLTHDHSVVAELVAAGVIRPDEIYTHPTRNQIYRSLGQKPTVEVETGVVPLIAGDTLLLCSDGLWEMVRDPQIASILVSPARDPAKTASALVEAALARGGADNISVVVVRVRKG